MASASPGDTAPCIILIVDDEPAIAAVLAAVVEDLGYKALMARNGHHALELARDRLPALLLTDLMMPVLDGVGLIAALRAEAAARNRPAPPAILITAARTALARTAGADAVLEKPFDLAELELLIVRLLAR